MARVNFLKSVYIDQVISPWLLISFRINALNPRCLQDPTILYTLSFQHPTLLTSSFYALVLIHSLPTDVSLCRSPNTPKEASISEILQGTILLLERSFSKYPCVHSLLDPLPSLSLYSNVYLNKASLRILFNTVNSSP